MKTEIMFGRLLIAVAVTQILLINYAYTQQANIEQRVFNFAELDSQREQSERSYLSFLNVDSLHCGIYRLAAGAKDGQKPHQQDEIYYVESGVAKIKIDGKDYDLKKGSIVFVPANAPHHFHSITEDLKTLVFFSKGPIAKQEPKQKPEQESEQEPKTKSEQTAADDEKLEQSINSALMFNATFDSVTDANLFDTHGWICTADSVSRDRVVNGNQVKGVSIAGSAGVSGDCLRFSAKTKQVLLYKSKEAAQLFPNSDWSGSVSFWLKLDPDKDLGDGFCDPIQIAGRKWNDGAIWVDFDNVKPRTFRLGVFSDAAKWNPKGLKWDDVPLPERPSMVVVNDPPFSAQRWTHVAITFSNINSTKGKLSNASLFLDGKLQGTIERKIQISWNAESDPQAAIMLGLNYIGDLDELAIFDRALSAAEVEFITRSTRQNSAE